MERFHVAEQARTYTVVLRPEPEGGSTVRVPALPEIVTYGEDETHALAMAEEAIPESQATPVREVTVYLPAA
jgi:hypothetical protein